MDLNIWSTLYMSQVGSPSSISPLDISTPTPTSSATSISSPSLGDTIWFRGPVCYSYLLNVPDRTLGMNVYSPVLVSYRFSGNLGRVTSLSCQFACAPQYTPAPHHRTLPPVLNSEDINPTTPAPPIVNVIVGTQSVSSVWRNIFWNASDRTISGEYIFKLFIMWWFFFFYDV